MTIIELEAEALRLDPRERMHLAHALVSSLGEISAERIQDLWLDEAELRDAELEAGEAESVPGPEVFARIRRRYA